MSGMGQKQTSMITRERLLERLLLGVKQKSPLAIVDPSARLSKAALLPETSCPHDKLLL